MNFLENIKFLGKTRAARTRSRKLTAIRRASTFRGGTPPRDKTIRRMQKQKRMGLSAFRKEVIVLGFARSPTKAKVRAVYPAKKVPHPNEDARKVGAPYYIADRG